MRISDWSSDVCSSDLAAIDIDLERYDKTWDVNVRGPLVWTQLAWKAAMAEHGGSVVNIASIGGLSVEPGIGIYNGTKAALIHLTKTLAAELSPAGRVNAIAPGLVKTHMARALWEPNEARTEERRGGQEGVRKCGSGGW